MTNNPQPFEVDEIWVTLKASCKHKQKSSLLAFMCVHSRFFTEESNSGKRL